LSDSDSGEFEVGGKENAGGVSTNNVNTKVNTAVDIANVNVSALKQTCGSAARAPWGVLTVAAVCACCRGAHMLALRRKPPPRRH
jgi:hypothetical protein